MTFRFQWEGLHKIIDLFLIKSHAPAFSDMKHELWKFWLAETIVFNLCKIIPIHY